MYDRAGTLESIEQKLTDLCISNKEAHDSMLNWLAKVNGCVHNTSEEVAVLKDQNDNQKWINRTIFGAVIVSIASAFIALLFR